MRNKQTCTKWIMLVPLLLIIMYSCYSEYEQHEDINNQTASLTVAEAKNLYEKYVGNTARLKSQSEDESLLSPDWSSGQLFSDSTWSVVESPLEFTGDRKLIFMPEGADEQNQEKKQILRLLVLRNNASGTTYSLMMLVIPSANYARKSKEAINTNKYLSRATDMDGMVLFYTVDGRFVNGWVYQEGIIIDALFPDKNGDSSPLLKASESYICVPCMEYFFDDLKGEWTHAYGVYCYPSAGGSGGIGGGNSGIGGGYDGIDRDGANVEDIPPMEVGGGSSSSENGNDKKPDKRTDCSSAATTNATNAQNAMKGNSDITKKLDLLRDYAKNKPDEYGLLINKSGNYNSGQITQGNNGSIDFEFNPYTVYDVHTHNKTSGFSGHDGYTGPSVADIYTTLEANETYYKYYNGNGPFKGSLIISYDGSEYLIAINDPKAAYDFFKNKGNLFEPNDQNVFKNKTMNDEYLNIRKNLLNNKMNTRILT